MPGPGRCVDLSVHPVDDVPFVPDNRTRTQMDLPGEGPVFHMGIDKYLADASHLSDLGQEIRLIGLSIEDQPRNPVFARVLDFCLFLRLDMRLIYGLY